MGKFTFSIGVNILAVVVSESVTMLNQFQIIMLIFHIFCVTQGGVSDNLNYTHSSLIALFIYGCIGCIKVRYITYIH